jgi:hypothetical protein
VIRSGCRPGFWVPALVWVAGLVSGSRPWCGLPARPRRWRGFPALASRVLDLASRSWPWLPGNAPARVGATPSPLALAPASGSGSGLPVTRLSVLPAPGLLAGRGRSIRRPSCPVGTMTPGSGCPGYAGRAMWNDLSSPIAGCGATSRIRYGSQASETTGTATPTPPGRRGCPQSPACPGTPGTLPHCLKGVGGASTRRTGRTPAYNQYAGVRPARREHAPTSTSAAAAAGAGPALRADDGTLRTPPRSGPARPRAARREAGDEGRPAHVRVVRATPGPAEAVRATMRERDRPRGRRRTPGRPVRLTLVPGKEPA